MDGRGNGVSVVLARLFVLPGMILKQSISKENENDAKPNTLNPPVPESKSDSKVSGGRAGTGAGITTSIGGLLLSASSTIRSSCPPVESVSAASSTTPPGSSLGHSSSAEVPPPQMPVDDSSSSSRVNKERFGGSAIKLLVSNNAAGSIIGRAGQTISELQQESRSRIKLSQSGDCYPGTQDRVCLVQGEREAIKTGLRLLLERLYMMQETMNTPAWHQYRTGTTTAVPVPSFDFIVRLLVPVTCCGMIIGKNGTNIKYLEESSGVTSVRLSPKEDGIYALTMERIVTITGNTLPSCLGCVFLIVDGMTSHPEISRYGNLTTSYANAAVSVYGNTASPPTQTSLVMPQQPVIQPPSPNIARRAFWDPNIIAPSEPSGMSRRSISSPDLLNISTTAHHHYHHIPHSNRPIGQHRMPSPELSDRLALAPGTFSSLQVPTSAAFIGDQPAALLPRTSLFDGHALDFGGMAAQAGMPPSASTVSHSASAPNLLAAQLGQALHISSSSLSSQPTTHHSQQPYHISPVHTSEYDPPALIPQTPMLIAHGCFTAQVLVPDSMIGSILGRGGRTLNELQMMSGTRIRISQRGEYMPGTRSRIVAIRGPTAQAVWDVQHMISQRMVLPPTAVYHMSGSVSFDNLQQLTGTIAEDSRGTQ